MKPMTWLAAGLWLALIVGAVGCSNNPKATKACKGQAVTSHECNACCVRNGAVASMWSGSCSCSGTR